MSVVEGWSPWIKLFGILFLHPELARPGQAFLPTRDADWHDSSAAARSGMWDALVADDRVRKLAQMVQDLDGVLSGAPPDLRTTYAIEVASIIGDDDGLRRAAIEALLWRGRGRSSHFALHAVIELVRPHDTALLTELADHPDRETQYRAKQVALSVRDEFSEGAVWPNPKRVGVADRLYGLNLAQGDGEQEARTWLGDRLLEKMVERTVHDLERQFAREYPEHHGVGEEKLVERFFTLLSSRFDSLDQAFLDTARATASDRRASVRMRYRTIDKFEEGKPGIARSPEDVPSESFAADLCLIIDPYLDGKPLGQRATLVQAKRLYLRDRNHPSKGWSHSYVLDARQTSDLLKQTRSSFFLFQGPGLAGRGLPILPAQLVSDLAHSQSATGGVLAADAVGTASRSFAEWFTYDLLALRVGDPYAPLVAKAENSQGSMPYDLFRYGSVEVQIRVGDPIKRDEL